MHNSAYALCYSSSKAQCFVGSIAESGISGTWLYIHNGNIYKSVPSTMQPDRMMWVLSALDVFPPYQLKLKSLIWNPLLSLRVDSVFVDLFAVLSYFSPLSWSALWMEYSERAGKPMLVASTFSPLSNHFATEIARIQYVLHTAPYVPKHLMNSFDAPSFFAHAQQPNLFYKNSKFVQHAWLTDRGRWNESQ